MLNHNKELTVVDRLKRGADLKFYELLTPLVRVFAETVMVVYDEPTEVRCRIREEIKVTSRRFNREAGEEFNALLTKLKKRIEPVNWS